MDRIKELRGMGVRVVGIGIEGGNGEGPVLQKHNHMQTIFQDESGVNHAHFCHNPRELINAIRTEAANERGQSGTSGRSANIQPTSPRPTGTRPRTSRQ